VDLFTPSFNQVILEFNQSLLDAKQPLLSDGINTTITVGRGDVYIENNTHDNPDGAGLTFRTSSNPLNGSILAVR
jgi:hypothetical protein